jgi:16S rRNA (guanine527-N7)-methyltransferase
LIDSNFIKFSQIDALNVSRETFGELEEYSSSILRRNKKINLISSSTEKSINTRHILDSVQIIDFIDEKNINICTDLGSGAGLPGIVLAILMKRKKPPFKVILYEKSFHKSNFLKEMSKKFKLNTEVHQKNIFEEKNLKTDIIISRAFKPLPTILDLAIKNFQKFESIIFFLGKTGKEILSESLTKWKFEYKEKKSITNEDSFLIKITNLKKRMDRKIISVINQKGGVR